jgi:peroxiredoxin
MTLSTFTRRGALGVASLLALAPRMASANPVIGAAAPDFVLPDQDGNTRRPSDFRGKIVVLEWSNHDCPYVRKHYGSNNMQGLQRLVAERGGVWLTIASSPQGEQGHIDGAQAKELTASRSAAPTAVLLDHASVAARLYRASTTPQMFIISADGVLRYMGGIDSIRSTRAADVARAEAYFRDAFLEVADGRPVTRASTPAYGCAIKYADA